jgi:hypothetical protein
MNARHSISETHFYVLKIATFLLVILMDACTHDPIVDSPNGSETGGSTDNGNSGSTPCNNNGVICFESNVMPIFQSSCAQQGCHNATSRREGLVLDSYVNIMKKGIAPGNANQSKLYRVLFADGEDQMPPQGPLTAAQKDSIRLWIDQGAKNTTNCNCSCDTTRFEFSTIIQPLINTNCGGCHSTATHSGNIDLSSYTAIKANAINGKLLGSVMHTTGYVAMPEGGKLSDCQISQIANWINAGEPNN